MDTAVVGSLLGVVIGAAISTVTSYLLAVRNEAAETRNWRRDRALETYSTFSRLVDTISLEANNAYLAECQGENHNRHSAMIVEKLSEMYRTMDRIYLLAPVELQAPLSALSKHVVGDLAAKSIQCPNDLHRRRPFHHQIDIIPAPMFRLPCPAGSLPRCQFRSNDVTS